MTDIPDDEATLRTEFDVLAKRAGLHIPDDRREWLFAGFKDLRKDLPRLRQPRTAASEPAAVYSMDSILRTITPRGVRPGDALGDAPGNAPGDAR